MSRRTGVLLAAAFSSLVSAAHADDAAFLASFEGSWSGNGRFRISTSSSPMSVSCSFEAATSASSLSLDGKCRGMVVVSRRIAVMLNTDGGAVSGAYVGSTTGPAGLSGARQGDAFDLSIRWAKPVNGDQEANMKVEKVGANGMKLVTTDVDPNTGKGVVTGEIVLSRL